MNNTFSFINKQDYALPLRQEWIELAAYSVICFFIPMLMGHPQWLVGTLVNTALVLAGLNLRSYSLLPVIILPSIGVFIAGALFGKLTSALIFMIPFIWAGNAILVFAFKKYAVHKRVNKAAVLVIGAVVKTAFLFLSAYLLFNLGAVPALFLTTMGLFQLYTALAGGALALSLHHAKKTILQSK